MYLRILFTLLIAVMAATVVATPRSDQKDRDAQIKLALDELKNEVVVLERQVRDMQASMDRNSGQMSALINQIVDNVNAIRQAQSRVAEGSTSAITQTNNLGEQLSATNQRIERLSGQMAELKRLVENLPKLPTMMQITPGNPDQLFAAAYGDYSRGNYDLAISEFRQYVETYPTSEMADNAQYWIGEALYAKKQLNEAIVEFDKVITIFSKGDKVPAARLKKGMALIELGQTETGRAELASLIRLFPRSNEAQLARQQLGEK
ncbi:MAG: hypothetical protein V7641_724 [Blastocatellia bacterium]